MDLITPYKQINPNHCQSLAQMGYQSLINLRADNEVPNQPSAAIIAQAATQAGLTYHHFPIVDEILQRSTVQSFAQLVNNSPKPVMIFCGTGGRAKRLYQSAKILGLLSP